MKPELTQLDDIGKPVLEWNTGAASVLNSIWSASTQEFRSFNLQIKTSKCQIIGKHTLLSHFTHVLFNASLHRLEEIEVVKTLHL